MKKFCIIVVVILSARGGVLAVSENSSAKQETINQYRNDKRKIRCTSCNGTGFAGSGKKGEGNYSCTRCKGDGKIQL